MDHAYVAVIAGQAMSRQLESSQRVCGEQREQVVPRLHNGPPRSAPVQAESRGAEVPAGATLATVEPRRRILHVDMDAFYASVEQRDDPALRGRPVVVGGSPQQRGVVAAASYEARAFGVQLGDADGPRGPPVPRNSSSSGRTSRGTSAVSPQVFDLFREVTPLVEPLSLDEAYLDVTENAWGETLGVQVARRLKDEITAHDAAHGLGGRGPQQVPREDRLGVAEARRADGHRARTRRAVPGAAARRRAHGASAP